MSVHEVFIYLHVRKAAEALDFFARAFGAVETFRLAEPSGRIGHAEMTLGPATLMISEEFPEFGIHAPDPDGPRCVTIHLHVDDADAMLQAAEEAGGRLVSPAKDQFHGERSGVVRDPFGYHWLIGHPLEAVEPAEMQARYTAMMADPGGEV